jgi:hypothetical protein
MSMVYDRYFGFDVLCNEIINTDNDIDLVTVLNHKGRVIEIKARDEIMDKCLTPLKREMFFMQCVLQASMNKDHDDELGKVTSSILEREKFTVFSFEFFNYVILVVTRPNINSIQLKNNILDKIANIKKVELA